MRDMDAAGVDNRQRPSATGERWAWRRWLLPRSYLVASTFLYLGVLGSFLYRTLGMGCHCSWSTHAGMVGATAALLVLERVLHQRHGEELPRGAALWSFGLHAALFELIVYLDSFIMSPFLYLLLPFLARLQLGRAAGRVVTALALLRYTVGLWLIRPDWYRAPGPLNDWLIFAIGLSFVSMLAEMVVREREQRTELGRVLADLAESHRQLQVYAAQVAALSKAEERNRLARDIHDSLGHYLTVINVQLEKALAFRERAPREAEQAIRDAKTMGSEALREVRRSVGTLRGVEQPFSLAQALARLAETASSAQCPVELQLSGEERRLSEPAQLALYRVAQEGLTNVRKHAGASSVVVQLAVDGGLARLTIVDDGRGIDLARSSSRDEDGPGFGLQGMRERLEPLGGQLRVERASGGGTIVEALVPC